MFVTPCSDQHKWKRELFALQVIHSKFDDLVPKVMEEDDPELQRPDDEDIADVSFAQLATNCVKDTLSGKMWKIFVPLT